MPLTKIGKEGITGISNSSDATAFTIDSSENIMVGHSSLNSPVADGGSGITLKATGEIQAGFAGTILKLNFEDGDGTLIEFRRDGTTCGSITQGSSSTTYNTTSDARLKENIESMKDGTEKLMAMNPVTFTWKSDPDKKTQQGFIAQDMQDISPESVNILDGQDMLGMDYGRITPIIVSALQDALKRIQELEEKINVAKSV